MDRALLVKNAVSTVKTIKTFRVPVVRSTVNVAAGRDSQPSPTSPAAYQLDHLPASRRFWPSPRSGDPAADRRPATCSRPPPNPPKRHRSPGIGPLNMNDGCTHLVIRSYEWGEDWYWCYLDRLVFELQGVPPAPSHP